MTRIDLASVDKVLTTTRSVRRRLDFTRPVEPEVIEACIEIARQSPSASNTQKWRFLVLTDPHKKNITADLYRKAFREYWDGKPLDDISPSDRRMLDSAVFLAEHFHEAPAQVLFCVDDENIGNSHFDTCNAYGSILPAAWSFMLAARARGIGCCWTTAHLRYEAEAQKALGIPASVTQCVLIPLAYFTGDDFHPIKHAPGHELTHWNSWGTHR